MFFLGIHHRDVVDLGRAEGVGRKGDGILVVFDDVDLFPPQLPDDGLHAHALHPDARAHAVDVRVLREDGHLAALARLARDRLDDDRSVVDFRDFHLKQPLHEHAISPRDHHLRPARGAVNLLDHAAQAIADLVGFQAQLLAARHARFGAPQINDHLGAFHAFDRAIDQLAHPVRVFGVDGVAFRFAHLLENHLLRGLSRDPAEYVRRLGNPDFALERGFRLKLAGLIQRHFAVGVSHQLHHLLDRKHFHRAALFVEMRLEVLVGLVVLPRRHEDRIFHRSNDDLRVDALLAAQLIDGLVQQARRHKTSERDSSLSLPSAKFRVSSSSLRSE